MGWDWATASAVIVAVAAVIGLIIQHFNQKDKSDNEPSDDEKQNLRINSIEIELKHLNENLELLRKKINDHEERDLRDFEKLEHKIEKLTDLMIELIQNEKK